MRRQRPMATDEVRINAELQRLFRDVEETVVDLAEQTEKIRAKARVRPGADPDAQRRAQAAIQAELTTLNDTMRDRVADVKARAEATIPEALNAAEKATQALFSR